MGPVYLWCHTDMIAGAGGNVHPLGKPHCGEFEITASCPVRANASQFRWRQFRTFRNDFRNNPEKFGSNPEDANRSHAH
jgi:hypothetical protein